MKYRYNKFFFGEWMRQNRYMIKDIIAVLGTSSYQSANRWMSGAPMPVDAILKLCNNFPELKVSDFIIGYEEGSNGMANQAELLDPRSVTELETKHAAEIESVKADYEKRLADQQKLMQGTIDSQLLTIRTQQLLIQQLRGEQSPTNKSSTWMVAEGNLDDK